MKSLKLYIQSALESLDDCSREVSEARRNVYELEEQEKDPPVNSVALDRVLAHCQKAQRELHALAAKVR